MKKNLLSAVVLMMGLFLTQSAFAQKRYIDEVFTAVQKTSNISYDSNYAINLLYGNTAAGPYGTSPVWMEQMLCDIYQPTGDTATKRPVIILSHTGSYIPPFVNQQTTGSKNDSSIVEIATKFAKRGYVVIAMNYRLGWNPQTTVQADAREQLLKATYRGLQDMRGCVRFARNNAATYKIDTSRIVLGGQGTGGYISLASATVSKRGDIESNPKFLRGNTSPMVNADTLGDWTGIGGLPPYNVSKSSGVPTNFHMAFNIGGAMGDTAWMKTTSIPMVSLHCTRDPFAPYRTGNVVVPITGLVVIPNASGGGDVIPKANALGINNKLNQYKYVDQISQRAQAVPPSQNNIFGFETSFPAEGSPWEWWDRPTAQATTFYLYRGAVPIPASGRNADSLSFLTNPYMSAARGRAYCDTIVRFIAPRIAVQLDLTRDASLVPYTLLAPANNTIDSLAKADSASTATKFTFRWNSAAAPGAMPMTTGYAFFIDRANGDFSNPLYAASANDTFFTISKKDLWNTLTNGGYALNQTASLKWTAVATNFYFSRQPAASFNLTLKKTSAAVGLSNLDYSAFLNVYPNPATTQLTVNLDHNKASISEVVVIDMMGRELMKSSNINGNTAEINLNNFTSGIYFVNVKTNDGATAVKRFMVN